MNCKFALLMALAWCAAAAAAGRAETVYFKVGELFPNHGDSYVLPLSNPADIAAARHIIEQGPLNVSERIVVARIAPGADGINRNLGAPFQVFAPSLRSSAAVLVCFSR